MIKRIIYCPVCKTPYTVIWNGAYLEHTCTNPDCGISFIIGIDLSYDFKAEVTD